MISSDFNEKYVDRFIYRELSDIEIEKFVDQIANDSNFSRKIELRELEIIQEYLSDKLEKGASKKIELRIKSDVKFKETVSFIRSLNLAAKEINKRITLDDQLNDIKQKIEKEKENGTYIPLTPKHMNNDSGNTN